MPLFNRQGRPINQEDYNRLANQFDELEEKNRQLHQKIRILEEKKEEPSGSSPHLNSSIEQLTRLTGILNGQVVKENQEVVRLTEKIVLTHLRALAGEKTTKEEVDS